MVCFFLKKSPQLPFKQKIFAEEILVLKNKINGKMRKWDAILRFFQKNQGLGTPKGIIQETIISQLRKTTYDIAQECTLTSVSVIEN